MDTKLEMFSDVPGVEDVEGEMTIPANKRPSGSTSKAGPPDFDTLDEPIRDTIFRDIRAVGVKFFHVLYPKEKSTLLRDWDLWGPLVLCTFMATILHGSADNESEGGPEFAQVFVIVWIGAMIVTLNSKLLGGNISFFQSVCVLGYCLTPVAVSLIVCQVILLASVQTKLLFFIRLVTTIGGFMWATYASFIFLGDSQPANRKPLAVYPIFLFYFIISWLVISDSNM
ncbi:protein YIPF6 [Lutzomyia longipalpis]|uniref:Protein YIPF n=1 Tax=Lutzomyia longipalpis TaxID=7200 RepID=A0A1B0CHY6_LUTLO|nr:protein YIPF6 [Lutzomyia longipalpis]